MFAGLSAQSPDKIIGLMQAFRADPRTDKVDLGVGVYRAPDGTTPVMRAVKRAEQRLWEEEATKSYTALEGDAGFHAALSGLLLGPPPEDRLAYAATPGGTGAVRQALELLARANASLCVWLPGPTWPNHPAIIDHLGLKRREYRYYDPATQCVDFDAMMADLARIGPDDVVLLHGCCHNPTGADLTLPQWQEITAHLGQTGALPLIDIAYLGFGDGPEADAQGLSHIVATLPEALICMSCSKNFGLYRERTGLLMALSPNLATRDIVQGNLSNLNRQNFAFPPDHGARLVTMVLNDPALRRDWLAELTEMRNRMQSLRGALAEVLRAESRSDRFGFLTAQRGMFSLLGASTPQVAALRETHGIYMIGDSRINIAGLPENDLPRLARAFLDAGL
ncbi:aromatic amino acid aminotransferase [Rhodovulum imhoffii]|uniref:Aromatic amino acid aminotransferase n=2 Tax=Rhodovulum imhoffii TaxID=365340 RepID=A0A2T5BU97_9RHOB|nr:amino acid aminotransferase [Rhodovulum imhoffii]MBK5934567.1 aromatic amino acid aminotransferase [Rhodovulum imhoffii]PTN03016.1 aromatic amino acid aminotransferase [Rhodovulum imhoffii]